MKPPLFNPKSEIRNPKSHRGVTLIEVLIAMGILAVGLLGAAAMFPVGGYFMQKGDVADRGTAIAQAAFADLVARDQLSPENWQVWNAGANQYQPMGKRMRQIMLNTNRLNNEPGFQTTLNKDAGFIYVIDPLGTAGALQNSGIDRRALGRAPFGANPDAEPDGVSTFAADAMAWDDFKDMGNWPVRRLSSNDVSVNGVPLLPLAEQLFGSGDDLAFSVDDGDVPTKQRVVGYDANNDGTPETPLARQSKGDYSWLATIAPVQSDAREALALDPSAYYFDVSVVVFYKRAVRNIANDERLVWGEIISTGTGGGEILLSKIQDGIAESPFKELKQGQWVMVSGPHPTSTQTEPLFFTQWYRVLAIDDEERGPIRNADKQRLVGLRGPDWPWGQGASVRVGLFPGAVAVHTKTMRLESLGPFSGR